MAPWNGREIPDAAARAAGADARSGSAAMACEFSRSERRGPGRTPSLLWISEVYICDGQYPTENFGMNTGAWLATDSRCNSTLAQSNQNSNSP